ncbi:MAG: hypothetical protein FJ095_04105 [Deltaproteobacteria bacterium]|nr:hypothetical protein [Deltaproteobacteria bacterium]
MSSDERSSRAGVAVRTDEALPTTSSSGLAPERPSRRGVAAERPSRRGLRDAADASEGGDAPAPVTGAPEVEEHVRGAWQVWLASLATDADAATVAAHLYAELPDGARDAWLSALAEDAPGLGVPEAAIYGPLLAVESDPQRRERILRATNTSLGSITEVRRALMGTAPGGVKLAVLVIPLYLDFVRVLSCRIVKDRGFEWVQQLPIVRDADAPDKGTILDDIKLYPTSRDAVVDELAHAVLAQRRSGRPLPQVLRDCADLFSATAFNSDA